MQSWPLRAAQRTGIDDLAPAPDHGVWSTEQFDSGPFARDGAAILQILGRPGEVWLPESGTDHISVIRSA